MDDKRITAIFSKDEEESIARFLLSRRIEYYLVYRLAIETGMSMVDIVKLKVKNLRNTDTVLIPVQSNSQKDKGLYEKISPTLNKEIQDFIKDKKDEDYFVTNTSGKQLSISAIQKAFMRASVELNLDYFSMSSCRKTYLLNKIKQNVSLSTLRLLSGYNSEELILKYIGFSEPYSLKKFNVNDKYDLSNIRVENDVSIINYARTTIEKTLSDIYNRYSSKAMNSKDLDKTNDFLTSILKMCDDYKNSGT